MTQKVTIVHTDIWQKQLATHVQRFSEKSTVSELLLLLEVSLVGISVCEGSEQKTPNSWCLLFKQRSRTVAFKRLFTYHLSLEVSIEKGAKSVQTSCTGDVIALFAWVLNEVTHDKKSEMASRKATAKQRWAPSAKKTWIVFGPWRGEGGRSVLRNIRCCKILRF